MKPRTAASEKPPGDAACPVCGGQGKVAGAQWRAACTQCDFEFSWLEPQIDESHFGSAIDEDLRRKALDPLRTQNALRVIDSIHALRPLEGAALLDVGCAYGWFLEVAKTRHCEAMGIEPEAPIAAEARRRGFSVITGFFPQAVSAGQCFDAICFNDVLEHIPAPTQIAAACFRHLRPGGLVSVVLPLRSGMIYRTAVALEKAGVRGPIERMWQKSFHSPHLSYFSSTSLDRLMRDAGFEPVFASTLPSVTAKGLWSRLRYDRTSSPILSAIQWAGLTVGIPFLSLLPGDIGHFIYRKPEG